LLYRVGLTGQPAISILTWPVVVYLFVHRWPAVRELDSLMGGVCGVVLLTVVLSHCFFMTSQNVALPHLYPLLVGIGIVLLVAGFQGLTLCWRELTLLFVLSVPRLLLFSLDPLPLITAKIGAFIIWYLGQEVEVVGPLLVLAKGAVRVDQGCAGPGVMSYLLCLAVIIVFLFRLQPRQRVLLVIAAPSIAFVTNVVRVVFLALLEGSGRHGAFDFWHNTPASMIWNAVPVFIFGMLVLSISGSRKGPVVREDAA
jgi:cyanoexosortase A